MGPVAALLPCGTRLHLQHGPIDLIIGADGDRALAFEAARARFETILDELVSELDILQDQMTSETSAQGRTARRMIDAVRPHGSSFVTPMAAVAGSVADEVLAAMRAGAAVSRAYVNNGGDIAVHLGPGQQFVSTISNLQGREIARISLRSGCGVAGIATSGRGGRSLSLGIADSVTVLGRNAASADAAATMVANAVDLPDHTGISRRPACEVRDDSDLGEIPVVTVCPKLSETEKQMALSNGAALAHDLCNSGIIRAACLTVQGMTRTVGNTEPFETEPKRIAAHA